MKSRTAQLSTTSKKLGVSLVPLQKPLGENDLSTSVLQLFGTSESEIHSPTKIMINDMKQNIKNPVIENETQFGSLDSSFYSPVKENETKYGSIVSSTFNTINDSKYSSLVSSANKKKGIELSVSVDGDMKNRLINIDNSNSVSISPTSIVAKKGILTNTQKISNFDLR